MNYVSGWIVWSIYTWLGWSGEVAEPIGSSVPVRFGTHYRFHLHRQVNEVWSIHLPMKMEPIVSSETSAIRTQTPGNYPKRNNLRLLGSSCRSVCSPARNNSVPTGRISTKFENWVFSEKKLHNSCDCHEGIWKSRVTVPQLFNLSTRQKWVFNLTLGRSSGREATSANHWRGSWVASRASLEASEGRKWGVWNISVG